MLQVCDDPSGEPLERIHEEDGEMASSVHQLTCFRFAYILAAFKSWDSCGGSICVGNICMVAQVRE